jgi:hypothetical protein
MLNDSLKNFMSDAAREAGFRVQAPNSSARDILVIPLDEAAGRLVGTVAEQVWRNARFVPFTPLGDAWRTALGKQDVDLVVVIGNAGANLSQAIAIGEICITRQIKVSGVLMRGEEVTLSDMSASLRSMRPWTRTLAVIGEQDYLPGLLHALGA